MRRTPLVKQVDQSDCGAAALASVAMYYRIPVGLQQMRDLAGTDEIGTNLLGLVTAAERLGFAAKAVKGPVEAMGLAKLPAIAHIKNDEGYGHYVVIYRFSKRHVLVADPARGVEKWSIDKFAGAWTGYLVLLTPDRPVSDDSQTAMKPAKPVSPSRRLFELVCFHRGMLVEIVVCALLMTLLGISTSYFVQHLVDSVLVRGESGLLNAIGLAMFTVLGFRTMFSILRQYLLAHIGRRIDLSLVSGYMRHLLSLPMSFFETRRIGEILSRLNDAGKVRDAISGATLAVIIDGWMVIVVTAVLWIYDAQLALVATLLSPLLVVAVAAHHPTARRRSRQAMEYAAELSAHQVEDVSGVETIKAFGAQRLRLEDGEDRLVRLAQSGFSLQKLSISMSTCSGLISGAAGITILWFGGHRVIEGALTIGELMFFYTLLGYLLGPLERLASINLQIQDALIAVDRLYQVLDIEIEEDATDKATFSGLQNGLELRDVRFQYGCRDEVIRGVDLDIPAGSTVAIVGESGCGKSTLLKLLMRTHTPTSGQLLADGVDLRDLSLDSLRDRIGVVSQDAFVFNGTIRDNLAMSKPNASLNEIIEAADTAGLTEFIASLPDRYDTMIGERGANLSGGQRQRLAIARAILKQPEILLFDEATSQLDSQTESAIQQNLSRVFADKTVVVVAHRLSTIRSADRIAVMHDGEIVEQGTHDQLLQAKGRYHALWQVQSGAAGSDDVVQVDTKDCIDQRDSLSASDSLLFTGGSNHVS